MGQYALQIFCDGNDSYRWVVFEISEGCFMQSIQASQSSHTSQASALAEGAIALQLLDAPRLADHWEQGRSDASMLQ